VRLVGQYGALTGGSQKYLHSFKHEVVIVLMSSNGRLENSSRPNRDVGKGKRRMRAVKLF
jgi:hypothetical protein